MENRINKINFEEAEFFYKNPHSLVDYSQMQSFSLIKSSVEIFAYYNINTFAASDIKAFFEKLAVVQKKNEKVFIPSAKKVSGVLDCCLVPKGDHLSFDGEQYHIEKWNCDGYKYEIMSARDRNLI